MQIGRGNWYGKKYYFGMHYDLHANANDTELGTHCSPAELVPMLKIMKPDFVQTDCKGHPGMTSWFTQVPDGTVSPGVVKDAMAQWREATKQLKLPLHCHYSGIWDMAAAKKHPEWTVVPAPGSDRKSEKMCPRSPYLEKLLIPQLIELIDRYEVDGFWIDGDLWAVEPCYCKK
ncbi:MAG: alpha-L-fucosidase, partial [Victivallales bacterium]|nr:alpha-L-fucosidase [Victivallales bacterium]